MAASPTPARQFDVDGRGVWVFDGLLPDVAAHVAALDRAPFTRTEVARPDTAAFRHWVNEIPVEILQRHPLQAVTLAAVSVARPDHPYRAYRAYTNHATFGDMLFSHTDCLPDQHDLTALWFMCVDWDVEWGGETTFFDERGEIACAVLPRPGRLVVFDGAIRHVGRPPSRICPVPRYTLALKLEPRRA
jgi:hypothetical protein